MTWTSFEDCRLDLAVCGSAIAMQAIWTKEALVPMVGTSRKDLVAWSSAIAPQANLDQGGLMANGGDRQVVQVAAGKGDCRVVDK